MQERDDVLRALVCVGCQLLPDVQHTCLCSFTWGLSVAECNRRAKLGCIEVLAMLRERGDSIQVCACQLSLQSIALILAHSPLFLPLLQTRWEVKAQLSACASTCLRNEAVYLWPIARFGSDVGRPQTEKETGPLMLEQQDVQ